MNKHIITLGTLLVLIIGISINTKAQIPALQWAKQIGNTSNELGLSMSVDLSGNVYTAGVFGGTVDFDPGPATLNIASVGSTDAFITKLDPSGNLIWAKTFGGYLTFVYGITTDVSGNLYITGSFQDTSDFDPGANTYNLISAGSWDTYIAKWDAAGNFLWAKRVGGGGANDAGNDVAVDIIGNVHIAGIFNQTVDFDPGPGTSNITAAGSTDSFILKLDASGNFIWAKSVGGTSSEQVQALVLDGAGSVYFVGDFFGTCDFDPGTGTYNLTSAGSGDAFICKLDNSGNFAWAMKAGGTNSDKAYSIAADNTGNILITGYFDGVVDFDPGPGVANLSSNVSSIDAFVLKLDGDGNYTWAKKIGGSTYDGGRCITSDASSNVYFAGNYTGTVDFDPGTGSFILPGNSDVDIFISKLDANGNFVWAVGFGGLYQDVVEQIVVDAAGMVYCTGNFEDVVDFDPGPLSLNFTSAGVGDVFTMKLTQSPVGISENLVDDIFSVYPNPANDEFMISGLTFPVEVKMFNAFGHEVLSKQMKTANSKLPMLNLPSGIYFIELLSENKKGTRKIIVQH